MCAAARREGPLRAGPPDSRGGCDATPLPRPAGTPRLLGDASCRLGGWQLSRMSIPPAGPERRMPAAAQVCGTHGVRPDEYCALDARLRAAGCRLVWRYVYVWERWECHPSHRDPAARGGKL